jgi:hypothetical protein
VYVFTGEEKEIDDFWERGGSDTFPYLFVEMRDFFKMAGPVVPAIYLVENGRAFRYFHYRSLQEKEISDFFAE